MSIEPYLDCRVVIRAHAQPWVLPVSGSPPGACRRAGLSSNLYPTICWQSTAGRLSVTRKPEDAKAILDMWRSCPFFFGPDVEGRAADGAGVG